MSYLPAMLRYALLGCALAHFAAPLTTLAQSVPEPCGTVAERSTWLADFQRGLTPEARPARTDVTIALHTHLLAPSAARPFSYVRALETMGALERDFVGTGVRFRVNLPFDTIVSAAYDDHATVLEGADLMFANNVDGALNLYLVSNPAGNCGYNLPYAGIAVASQCAGAASKTMAHEVGHALSLPHPFLGWEGGQTTGGDRPADFGRPAPRTVTYDYTYFQDTLIRDTTIIDTALVELVDRSNCREAADGFCDTPADYLARRWTCNNNGVSNTSQLDPDSVAFVSDGSLIMSYSDDDCQQRFSPDQALAMQAFAQQERSSWIRSNGDTATVSGDVEPAFVDGDELPSATVLPFTSAPNATHYYVQISARRSLSSFVAQAVTTDTFVVLDPSVFEVGEEYYWRVYPYSDHSFRRGFSPRYSFVYPMSVGAPAAASVDIAAFPNPVAAGSHVQLGERWAGRAYGLRSAVGQVVQRGTLDASGQLTLKPATPQGVYVLVVDAGDAQRAGGQATLIVTD